MTMFLMSVNNNLYFAKSGETVAMSELLLRGYNVAVPSVDIGDDIYVVEDAESNLIRVQVKSANCQERTYGFVGQVRVRLKQVKESKRTKLVYVFALRFEQRWHFVVISRDRLEEEVDLHNIGTKYKDDISFTFRYRKESGELLCTSRDLSQYLSWDTQFPGIKL